MKIGIFKEFETILNVSQIDLERELDRHIESWSSFYLSLFLIFLSSKNDKKYIGYWTEKKFWFFLHPLNHKLTDIFSSFLKVENHVVIQQNGDLKIKTLIKSINYVHLVFFIVLTLIILGALSMLTFMLFAFPLNNVTPILMAIAMISIFFFFVIFNPIRKNLKRMEPLKYEIQELYKGFK